MAHAVLKKGKMYQSQSISQKEIPGRVSSLAFDMNSFFSIKQRQLYMQNMRK